MAHHPIFHTTHCLEGDSHTAILEHAEKECDLLVMGAFADRQVEALALGTTTEGHCCVRATYLCSCIGRKSSFYRETLIALAGLAG